METRQMPEAATSVITVRLPESVHEALKKEAHRREMSLNSMCVEELTKAIPENQ
jgi:predicted HicB family RNase H-like nuclease